MSRANGIAGEALPLQRGFSWDTCGKPEDPTYVKTLHVYPNPIPSPGYVMASASASTSLHLRSPFSVNLTLEREVAGVWIKVPCVDDLGSCYYPDACVRLAQLFMWIPQLCPEPKPSSSVPCGCPFRAISGDLIFIIVTTELPSPCSCLSMESLS
ncbi:ganglioside GM2 activator [Carassius gibelio]|uniref:ganglioside GM2 activator n=1 Tax=Carassius gibelio TaxID=101364 RepID=UPI0022799FE4|nr:ganglioside GM2 activator [Carassius gibelio]